MLGLRWVSSTQMSKQPKDYQFPFPDILAGPNQLEALKLLWEYSSEPGDCELCLRQLRYLVDKPAPPGYVDSTAGQIQIPPA